jgi:MFS family permease
MSLIQDKDSAKKVFMNIFLVVNTFVWYFFAFSVLRKLVENSDLLYVDTLTVWTLNFGGAAISALVCSKIADWFKQRFHFMQIWLLIGFLSSLTPIFMDATPLNLSIISFLYGVSFGFGMPTCMEYFADATAIENRGRNGGISFFVIAIGVFVLSMVSMGDFFAEILISAVWRGFGLIALFFIKPFEKTQERRKASYASILSNRTFLFYIVPWWMFCLVNYANSAVLFNFFGEDFVLFSSILESVLMSIFAIVGGYLADAVGRKRVAIAGFVMLGLGYAALGVYPELRLGWYFYTVVDGIAWGIFYVVFLIVLWGDIAYNAPSGKFYALGGMPFLLSHFIRIIIGSYIGEAISVYTIFSFASFFLFLAVLPLMYAPETLPEKTMRDRELKEYIEKAKKKAKGK